MQTHASDMCVRCKNADSVNTWVAVTGYEETRRQRGPQQSSTLRATPLRSSPLLLQRPQLPPVCVRHSLLPFAATGLPPKASVLFGFMILNFTDMKSYHVCP